VAEKKKTVRKKAAKAKPVKKAKAAPKKKAAVKKRPVKKKAEKKPVKKEKKKPVEKKKTVKIKARPKGAEAKKSMKTIKIKRKKIKFHGRFGKRHSRRKTREKWAKWSVARGIDIKQRKEDGPIPKSGRGSPRKIRGMHPSGHMETLIFNAKDVKKASEEKMAVRIAAKVGRKKKKEILAEAKKLKVFVIN